MSYQYQEMPVTVAAEATESERIGFIKLTYAHLGGAILLFVALSAAIRASGVAESMTASMLGSRGSWGVVLLLFPPPRKRREVELSKRLERRFRYLRDAEPESDRATVVNPGVKRSLIKRLEPWL